MTEQLWTLLNEGDAIQAGDEYYSPLSRAWCPCGTILQGCRAVKDRPVRRRATPDALPSFEEMWNVLATKEFASDEERDSAFITAKATYNAMLPYCTGATQPEGPKPTLEPQFYYEGKREPKT